MWDIAQPLHSGAFRALPITPGLHEPEEVEPLRIEQGAQLQIWRFQISKQRLLEDTSGQSQGYRVGKPIPVPEEFLSPKISSSFERQRKWGFTPTSHQEQGCSVITSTSEHHCSNLPQASLGRGPHIWRYFATHLKRWRFNCLGCGTQEPEQGRKAKEENKDSWISKVALLSSFLLLFACLVPQRGDVYSQCCENTFFSGPVFSSKHLTVNGVNTNRRVLLNPCAFVWLLSRS